MSNNSQTESTRFFEDLMAGFEDLREYARGERELRVTTLTMEPSLRTDAPIPNYVVLFEQGPRGWAAVVPDLPGCVASGDSLEDAEDKISEEIRSYLEAIRQDGQSLPRAVTQAKRVAVTI